MKKSFAMASAVVLALMLTLGAVAPSANARNQGKAKAPKAMKSDADIQSCIQDKLAKSAKLKDLGFQVTVTGGEAMFTGTTKSSSSKNSVNGMAKSCGAKKVTNNITVEKPMKPAKK